MIKINLTPAAARSGGAQRRLLGSVSGLAGLALLGSLALACSAAIREEMRLTQSIAHESEELAALKAALEREKHVRARVADLSTRISVIQELLRRQGTPTRILEALVEVVPPDLRLTSLEGRGLALRALGSAHSATAVADLMSGLHASGKFSDVDIVVSRQDLGEAVHSSLAFEVVCRFKD